MIDFETLQNKYGFVVAHSILMDLERHANLNSAELAAVDPETRLQQAVHMMEQQAA